MEYCASAAPEKVRVAEFVRAVGRAAVRATEAARLRRVESCIVEYWKYYTVTGKWRKSTRCLYLKALCLNLRWGLEVQLPRSYIHPTTTQTAYSFVRQPRTHKSCASQLKALGIIFTFSESNENFVHRTSHLSIAW